jgi:hypothetical protein
MEVTMSTYERATKMFKVRIDVDLPGEVLDRIERAVQKAVLTELADADIAGGYSVVMRVPANGDGGSAAGAGGPAPADRPEGGDIPPLPGLQQTDGIWIREERNPL